MSAGLGALVHRMRPATTTPATGALILFHGRGTNEGDLAPLLDAVDPDALTIGLTPRGPFALTPGGAHWYAVRRVGHPDHDTFHAALERAGGWLDSLPEATGVPIERTVLGGFSQGAVMAYALGLGRGRPSPAGVIGLSGFLPTVDGFELDLDGRAGLPAFLAHGTYDPIIGVEFGRAARERLEAAAMAVDYREAPIGHQVEPGWLPELRAWLAGALDRAG